MKQKYAVYTILILFAISSMFCSKSNTINFEAEKAEMKKVIEGSIGWALNKDLDYLYSILAQDENFFIYHPDSASTIYGFEAFKKHAETIFMNPKFKATHFEVKNLRMTLSRSGETGWFSCYLDDYGEWDGRPIGWENSRWTGVLEKRDNRWIIVQMHFSFPQD